MALQPGDDPVVPTPGTLRSPQRVLAVHPEELRGTVRREEDGGGIPGAERGLILAPGWAGLSLVVTTEQPLIGSRGPPGREMCYDRTTAG